jgi:hypothetical protein
MCRAQTTQSVAIPVGNARERWLSLLAGSLGLLASCIVEL